ncbi:MAG: hypothetical protein OEX23_09800 [Betaproteobacteria bacterium]|jgi:hypothetical protein|nr:hypothetical protein [Betaproteobacteria bacterium]
MAVREIVNEIERMRGAFARGAQPGMSGDAAALAMTRAVGVSVVANAR